MGIGGIKAAKANARQTNVAGHSSRSPGHGHSVGLYYQFNQIIQSSAQPRPDESKSRRSVGYACGNANGWMGRFMMRDWGGRMTINAGFDLLIHTQLLGDLGITSGCFSM